LVQNRKFDRVVEPFAGSASVSIFAAHTKISDKFLINDSYKPLMDLWKRIITKPEESAAAYEKIWRNQIISPNEYYLKIREEFNEDKDPIKFLFLMAKCAKNAIRFNSKGGFNQSADKRRLGRKPEEMRKQLTLTSLLLNKKVILRNEDYEAVLDTVKAGDLVYMDPPYLGTSGTKNPRYHQGLDLDRFIKNLEKLNKRNIYFIISFDGQHGEKKYGEPLPNYLNLKQHFIKAGRSAQATLNGKNEQTIESLYLSPNL
jgi:DNA adenine methylase